MPVDGHPPGLDRGFRLIVCPSCRAGNHAGCRPLHEPARHRLLYCECLGWERRHGPDLIVLACLLPEETP